MKRLPLLLALLTGCSTPEPDVAPPPTEVAKQTDAPIVVPRPQNSNYEGDQKCNLVFSEDIATQTFTLIGGTAPEGCKFEGVSTNHSKMTVRWETPPYQTDDSKKNIVDFLVVPTGCVEEFGVESSGSTLSAKASKEASSACPNQWAQLVQLIQAEKMPKPVSARETGQE